MADREKLEKAYKHLKTAERLIAESVSDDDGSGYATVGGILTAVNKQVALRRHTVFRFARGDQHRVAMTTPTGG